MTTEEIADLEDAAAEHAHRVLDLVESGRRQELAVFMDGLDRSQIAWVSLALAQGLVAQETANDDLFVKISILQRQNETVGQGNTKLFAERRTLTEKVAELRQIIEERARVAQKRKAA